VIILGLYFGHDSNVSIVRDGKVLYHGEVERTTRRKHEAGWHGGVLSDALATARITIDDVDAVAIGGGNCYGPWAEPVGGGEDLYRPIEQAARRACAGTTMAGKPMSEDVKDYVGRGGVNLGGRLVPIYVVHHHLSHSAIAYYTSPYTSALIASWDNGGDGAFSMLSSGSGNKIGGIFANPPYGGSPRASIGAAWTVIGGLYNLGCDHEGKVMGLAAYGTPRSSYIERIRSYMDNYWSDKGAAPVDGLFSDVTFDPLHEDAQDLAASIQAATEDVMGELIAARHSAGEPVVLSGGCAYNCVANGKLAESYDVYVSNCPHDGGLSLGAALFVWHHEMGGEFVGVEEYSPYSGNGKAHWISSATIETAAQDIAAGKVVAWYAGRSEAGKRALGNRSILLDPRRPDGKDLINTRVKRREWFRPFAPSVLEGHTDWRAGKVPPSRYMSFSCSVADDWRDKIPAVVHVDGTCRPQIVSKKTNDAYHRLITAFYELTGVPMVLNTSFNVQEPIVDTEEHAIATFNSTDIDVLYLNGERFSK
jgi:carbamoyltransferase